MLHKTGQLVILAAEKLQSSGAEEGVGPAEVFQSAVSDGAEEERFSLEAQEGGVRSSEREANFRECSTFAVPCEHWYQQCWLPRMVWMLKSKKCAVLCVAMQCFYSDTAEADIIQLPLLASAVQAFSLMNQWHVSISIWTADA